MAHVTTMKNKMRSTSRLNTMLKKPQIALLKSSVCKDYVNH